MRLLFAFLSEEEEEQICLLGESTDGWRSRAEDEMNVMKESVL